MILLCFLLILNKIQEKQLKISIRIFNFVQILKF